MTERTELQVKRSALDNESGQDLLEYALLASLIALVAFGTLQQVGNTINTVFWTAIANNF